MNWRSAGYPTYQVVQLIGKSTRPIAEGGKESIPGLRQPCDDRMIEMIRTFFSDIKLYHFNLLFLFSLFGLRWVLISVGSSWAFCGDWILDDALMAPRCRSVSTTCNHTMAHGTSPPSRNGRGGMCHVLRRNLGTREMSFYSFEFKQLKNRDTILCVNGVWTVISNVQSTPWSDSIL